MFLAEVSFVEPLATAKYFRHPLKVQFGVRHTLISSLHSSSFLHFIHRRFFFTLFFFETTRYFRHPLEVYRPTLLTSSLFFFTSSFVVSSSLHSSSLRSSSKHLVLPPFNNIILVRRQVLLSSCHWVVTPINQSKSYPQILPIRASSTMSNPIFTAEELQRFTDDINAMLALAASPIVTPAPDSTVAPNYYGTQFNAVQELSSCRRRHCRSQFNLQECQRFLWTYP